MTVIYLSGKYNSDTFDGITENIMFARKVAVNLWEQGYAVLCPHMNTAHFEVDTTKVTYDDWLKGDLEMLLRCDAIIMLPEWEKSSGAKMEKKLAEKYEIPVFYWPDHPEMSYFEVNHPEKVHETMGTIMKTYRAYVREG